MLGPFAPSSTPEAHINRMGVVPKGPCPGNWRLITDISFPVGGSINEGIRLELCSLH